VSRWRVLVVVATLCALAACEDEPTPTIPDPTPSSSSPSPTESESSPTTSPTPEALTPEETVRAWFEAWSQALVTGDVEPVSSLSGTECASCSRLIEQLVSVYDRGGRYETDGWKPLTLVEAPDSSNADPRFLLRIAETRRVLYDADGKEVDVAPREEVPMRMTLAQSEGTWLVAQLEILK
jgi:Family of unknown function (DUF6318)